jgi:hypothetical protein
MNSMRHRHRDEIVERDVKTPEVAAEVREKWRTDWPDPEQQARIDDALADVDLTQLARTAHRTAMVQAIRDPKALDDIKSLA